MRVCVIGAGPAGICAARRLQEDARKTGQPMEIRVFEQTGQLGGTWVMDQAEGSHSSMYEELRTNIPTVLMEFEDFPFPPPADDETSYPPQQKVLDYLQRFAEPMRHLIQFNTRVLSVRHHQLADKGDKQQEWEVTWQREEQMKENGVAKNEQNQADCAEENGPNTEHFDVIFVCIGHYSKPRIPHFVEQKLRKLPYLHSHDYKSAKRFAGKTVAVVGAGLSGSDIVMQLAEHAKKVYFLHMPASAKLVSNENGTTTLNGTGTAMQKKKKNGSSSSSQEWVNNSLPGGQFYFPAAERPPNCEERCRVVDANEWNLVLADGTELGPADGLDVAIFCTGYRYSFPFLETSGVICCPEDGSYVSPVWAKFVHIHHPRSLFLLGLPFPILPFPLFDCQMRMALALIQDRLEPPTVEQMRAEERGRLAELKKLGKPVKYFHKFDTQDPWHYLEWLDKTAGHPRRRWTPAHFGINEHFRTARNRTSVYRTVRYVIHDAEHFEVVKVGEK